MIFRVDDLETAQTLPPVQSSRTAQRLNAEHGGRKSRHGKRCLQIARFYLSLKLMGASKRDCLQLYVIKAVNITWHALGFLTDGLFQLPDLIASHIYRASSPMILDMHASTQSGRFIDAEGRYRADFFLSAHDDRLLLISIRPWRCDLNSAQTLQPAG